MNNQSQYSSDNNVNCVVNFVKSRNETRASSVNERQVYESNNLMAYTSQIWLRLISVSDLFPKYYS